MRIQRIDICGFKSFNERAVIAFDDGVTGIVGPNGCGKSNVVDAIRWVMGEQSAKHLRGRSMDDVIFAGSETQGPSGMAEVALTLRNDRPSELPLQYQGFSEITVARRLFRDGRSDYLINKTSCRLMDITELFLGTGVGTRAYSIIEQGRVGLIVNAKPEERRALLEEAAGITKYKARKKLAERKLEYTEQNLLRISDIAAELKRQVGALERQARKAERYRQLKDEMREIELHEASARWLELKASLAYLGVVGQEQTLESEQCASGVSELEVARTAQREELARQDGALEELKAKSHELALTEQREEQQRKFDGKRSEELQEQNTRLVSERVESESKRGMFGAERAELLELAATIDDQLQRDQEGQAILQGQVVERTEVERAARQEMDAARTGLTALESRAAGLRATIGSDERRRVDLASRLERARAESTQVEEQRVELAAQLGAITGQTAETEQLQLTLTARKDEVERSLAASQSAFKENEVTRRTVRDELSDRKSRLTSLEDLLRGLEGYGRGTRSVMMGAEGQSSSEPAIEGVRGLLADAFQAPQEFEVALEAYLEHRLQDVIVQDGETALRGVKFLEEKKGGRATFWPLDRSPAAGSVEPVNFEGCLGRGADVVQVAAGAEVVIHGVLGNVWIFRSLEDAVAAQAAGFAGDAVSLRGEVLSASGSLRAGEVEGPELGLLARRREVEELAKAVAELQTQLELSQHRHAELSQRVTSEEALLKTLTQDTQVQQVALATRRQDVRRLTEQLEALGRRSEGLRVSLQEGVSALDEVEQALVVNRESLTAAETAAAASKETAAAKQAQLLEVSRAVATANEQLVQTKVKLAGDLQRLTSTRDQLDRNQRQLSELNDRETAAQEQLTENELRIEELAERVARAGERLVEIRAEAEAIGGQLAAETEQRALALARAEEIEGQLRENRKRLEVARDALGRTQLREREAVLSLEHLIKGVGDQHATELAFEVHRFHLLPAPGEAAQERLTELRAAVERMGEINLAAIREHEDVRQRCDKMAQQKLDLENSVAQLREAIVRINRTSRDRLRETFELVNARFAEVFPRLFRGGTAGLALIEESGDVLEAGVEIFAQPPGKRLQSVNLLSGGEKALTAVALIFAIFLIKPTPFCLLDEVDAPLDEGNVGRYSDLVKEISKISQFILITHNKRSMQVADTLYGVTMEEPGCSKLVSVKLSRQDAAEAAA